MLFAGIVFVTTLMSWIFQVVLLAASQDAAEHLNGLKVDTVEQGPVLILTVRKPRLMHTIGFAPV